MLPTAIVFKVETMDLENNIFIEKKPWNEAAGCCEGNSVALGVLRCSSSFHRPGGNSLACRLQKALLSERTMKAALGICFLILSIWCMFRELNHSYFKSK